MLASFAMQEKTLISFIVPVFNIQHTTLCRCLESILNVEVEGGKEIIVVDDGSSKEVSSMLPQRLLSNICLIRQHNQGAAAARNAGLEVATGKYIQFVDADDYLLPTLYSPLLSFAISKKTDMLIFRSMSSKRQKEELKKIHGPIDGAKYMTKNYVRVMPWGYVFRRSACNDLRFTYGSFYEDEEFTPLLLLRCKKVFFTLSKAYFYSVREGSLTRTKNTDFTQKRFPDFERIILNLRHMAACSKGDEKKALERRVAQISEDHFYNIMRFTHSHSLLQQTIRRLEKEGVWPLPATWKYGVKYMIFRRLLTCRLARIILTKWTW